MAKTLLILPLLALVAHAQGVDGWITQALDPRLEPSERLRLLDLVINEGGIGRLANRGLDPKLDAEVIHAVVGKLFATGNGVSHVEPIIRLLLTDDTSLRKKIERRIELFVESPKAARALRKALLPIAAGEITGNAHKDPKLRIAAVRALRQIPWREAVQSIVDTWLKDKDATVQAECQRVLRDVLVPRTAEQASAYLIEHTQMNYRDFRDAVFLAQDEKIAELGKFQMEALKHADAARCFEVLAIGTQEGREIAADRLTGIVKTRKFGMQPDEFVNRTLSALVRERDRDAAVAARVIRILQELVQGGDKSPLRGKEARESLFRVLQPLTQKGPKWLEASRAAVALLGSLGVPAAVHLVAFARDSEVPEVRKSAVNKLGSLARLGTNARGFMGRELANLLEKEKAPEVRRQILFNLKSAPVEQAVGPIRKLVNGDLSDSEVEYCIEILRRIEIEAALDVLLKLANKPFQEGLRLYAIREGLLLRKSSVDDWKRIFATLEAMATAEQESETLRRGVVAGLGQRGGASAYPLLRKLAKNTTLSGDATLATKALVERLATDPRNIELPMQAVRDGALTGADLDKLIHTILATCDNAKLGASDMRYRRAMLFLERHKDSKDEKVRADLVRLLKEAVKLADRDGLAANLHADVCERLKTMLLAGTPREEDRRDAIECLVKLAELAGEEKAKAAAYFLEATDIAVKLKDRVTAEMLYVKARDKGAEETELAKLDERIKALPSAG